MEYRAWIRVPGLDVESDDAGRLYDAIVEAIDDAGVWYLRPSGVEVEPALLH